MKRYIFPNPPEHLDAHCELQPDNHETIVGVRDVHPDNGAPCISFDVPADVPDRNGADLRITKRGYVLSGVMHGILGTKTPGGGGFECDVFTLVKASGAVRPYRLDGHFPRYDDGTEMLINMSTGFRLGERFKNNISKADEFCQSLVDGHFNSARITLMQDTTLYLPDPALQYRIHPDDFGSLDAFQRWLLDLTDYLEAWGIVPSYVLCTQTQSLMADAGRQQAYVRAVFEALLQRYCILSKVNEHGIYDNTVDGSVLLIPKPAGANFLLSTGSLDSGNRSPLLPLGDHVEKHFNDANEWQRKGKDAMDDGNALDRAGYVSETTRTDKDDAAAGRARARAHYEDDANIQTSMTMAALLHTPEGKNADAFGFSVPHIEAHNKGVAAGGLAYRRGRYSRDDVPPAGLIRQYYMTVDGVGTHPIPVRM